MTMPDGLKGLVVLHQLKTKSGINHLQNILKQGHVSVLWSYAHKWLALVFFFEGEGDSTTTLLAIVTMALV
jgi:hypothetical protein